MRCDSCASATVNGVFVHEAGCPNQGKEYDENEGRWMAPEPDALNELELVTCPECDGEGYPEGSDDLCPKCRGGGQVYR